MTKWSIVTSGSFRYDSTTQTFVSFLVVWNGYRYDFTDVANNAFVTGTFACLEW